MNLLYVYNIYIHVYIHSKYTYMGNMPLSKKYGEKRGRQPTTTGCIADIIHNRQSDLGLSKSGISDMFSFNIGQPESSEFTH